MEAKSSGYFYWSRFLKQIDVNHEANKAKFKQLNENSFDIKKVLKSRACLLKLGGIPDFIHFTYIWKLFNDFL